MNKTTKIIMTSAMTGIAAAACTFCMAQGAYASEASVDTSTNTTIESSSNGVDKNAENKNNNDAVTSNEGTKELASGTTTDVTGKEVRWQVVNNAPDADASQMQAYGKNLKYDTNEEDIVTAADATPFAKENKDVVARKFTNITLKVAKGKDAQLKAVDEITDTPWFFKSQESENTWNAIDGSMIGSQDLPDKGIQKEIGGNGLSGLVFDAASNTVIGTPTVTDWHEGEASRVIPVYVATIHKDKGGSSYMTIEKLQEITVTNPNAPKPQPPVVPPAPKPPVTPVTPVTPEPVHPNPVTPVTPTPVTPVTPVQPVTPEPVHPNPVTPVTPVNPVNPVTPTPVTPVTPVTPTPVTPVHPVTPEPVHPVTPVNPAPVTPVTPVQPVQPVTPVIPVTPVQPEHINFDLDPAWNALISVKPDAISNNKSESAKDNKKQSEDNKSENKGAVEATSKSLPKTGAGIIAIAVAGLQMLGAGTAMKFKKN